MSFLSAPGDLAQTPLAAILLEALNLRASGVLEVAHGGGTSRLWFREGRPVGAQVFTGFRPLGHMLLQAGLIDIDALSKSLAPMAETRRPQGEILVEMGAVSADDVGRMLAEQQASYFGLIAALDAGGFQFDGVTPVPDWTRSARLLARPHHRRGARAPAGGRRSSPPALQPVAAGGVRLSAGYPEVAEAFRWTDAERALVARLDRPRRSRRSSRRPTSRPSGPARSSPRSSCSAWRRPAASVAGRDDRRDRPHGGGAHRELPGAPRDARPARDAPPPGATTPLPAARRLGTADARAGAIRPRRARGGSGSSSRRCGTWGSGRSPAARRRPASDARAAAGRPRRAAAAAARRRAAPDAARGAAPRGAPRRRAARPRARPLRPARGPGQRRARRGEAGVPRPRAAVPPGPLRLAGARGPPGRREGLLHRGERGLRDALRRPEAGRVPALGREGAGQANVEAAKVDFEKGEACLRTRDFARARGFLEAAVRADPRARVPGRARAGRSSSTRVQGPRPGARARRRRRRRTRAAIAPSTWRASSRATRGDDAAAERHFRAASRRTRAHADAVRELRLLEGAAAAEATVRSLSGVDETPVLGRDPLTRRWRKRRGKATAWRSSTCSSSTATRSRCG